MEFDIERMGDEITQVVGTDQLVGFAPLLGQVFGGPVLLVADGERMPIAAQRHRRLGFPANGTQRRRTGQRNQRRFGAAR